MKQMVFRKIDFKTNYSSKITWYHGIIEHFTMDPEILSIYLVNDCLYDEFANAGIQYIFIGDMHANYIAEYTTTTGNKLYDIETRSVVTYSSPIRLVTIDCKVTNDQVKESLDIKTIMRFDPLHILLML